MYKRIKLLREQHNLTIREISDFLNISSMEYTQYELGKKLIPINLLSKLAKKYNTSIDYIIEDTNSITPHSKN